MKAASKIDPSTLGWVKAEIDETMRQARLALESFAESPADTSHLRFCVTYLHQVAGTLKMVELDGPARLAQETEWLAEAVLQGQANADARVLEALTRAILALPDYLARLQFGEPESPARLLPRLNDLREARGEPPVSGLDLFNPDLTVRPPASGHARLAEDDFIAELKKMRPAFQAALLNWLREPQNPEHATGMAEILAILQGQAYLGVIEQLLWVAGGLLAALTSGDLEISNERKKLLSRVDQQIKKLIDGTEKMNLRASTEALTKAILFELMQAKGDAEPVRALKQAFDLDALAGSGEPEIELPSPEVLQSVAAALSKEIQSAQELLSGYFGGSGDRSLEPLLVLLEKMSRTLSALGVEPLKALVDELTGTVRAVTQGEVEGGESMAMQLAGSLLLLEHSAREIPTSGAAWKKHIDDGIATLRRLRAGEAQAAAVEGIEISDAELTDTEFKQLLAAVAGEIRVNLAKVEEGLERFAAAPGDPGPVQSLPHYLSQIQGALQILGQDRAAELTVVASGHVQDLMQGTLPPSRPVFEALAVAIGTVGAYLDGLERDRPNLGQVLDVAFQDLEAATNARPFSEAPRQVQALRKLFERWSEDTSNADIPAAMRQGVSDLGRLAQQHGQHKLEQVCAEAGRLLADNGGQMTDQVRADLQQSLAAMGQLVERSEALSPGLAELTSQPAGQAFLEPVPEENASIVVEAIAAPAPMPAPAPAIANGLELDEEIMQIFIEDARGMLNVIDAHLDDWIANPGNREALSEVRRAFHTLKGSGRMVGASRIAEPAWAMESLLNRVRDNQVSASEAIFTLLRETRALLPSLIGEIEGGPMVDADLDGLRLRAQALAAGETPSASADTPLPSGRSSTGSAASPAPSAAKIDPVLLQIFTGETRSHLATLRESLTTAPVTVSHGLLRAAHTLQGSSRSLGLLSMADASGELERLLQAAEIRHLPLSAQASELLVRLDACVTELLASLHDGGATTPALHDKFAAVAQALAAQTEQLSVYPPVREDDAPSVTAAKTKPTPVSVEVPQAAVVAEEYIDPELLEIFREEATDILESIDEALTSWRSDRGNKAVVHDLKRHLHTLKGGARMAGAMTIGSIGHHTESLLKQIEDNRIQVDEELLDLLDEVHDGLVSVIERLQHDRPMTHEAAALDAKLAARLEGREPAAPRPATAPRMEATAPPAARTPVTTSSGEAADDPAHDDEDGQSFERPERREHIKVRTSLLDVLVNHAGEVSIARSRMEQQIFGLREHLGELNSNVARFRQQLRELEIQAESQILYRAEREGSTGIGADFDPLEFDRFSKLQHLSRGLAESLHDLTTIQQTLDNFAAEAETALQQQARVNTDLQEGLMRTRMIGFATQAGRLRHIVRQTARELGKRAEFEIKGADVELDRNVLERMIGPLEHMIRNALDHGLESEEERRRAGKPAAGKITIETTHEGNEIVLRFADDGAGLDVSAIRRKAIERGLMQPSADLTDEEIVQFILLPGFSTAKKITHLSGRGVGMDVVHTEVKQLGGSITVNSERGAGTVFVIRLPLTLSITQALMVYAGEQMFAIPLSSIVNLLEVSADKISSLTMGEKPLFHHEDQVYPFMHLAARLGIPVQPRSAKKVPVLLVKTGARQIALQIDGMGSTREAVIKSLGPQISEIKGISGATILGDGRVVLILDIGGLWMDEAMQVVQLRSQPREAEARSRAPVVMVVDDSLTVRKITSRHLQRRGFEVMVAKDGLDAMEQLREQVPDIMLVDIEMPRMDGYELTANVRSDPTLRHVPIIMITSRAGTKHRDRAMQLGVNLYMSKPYQEEELMGNIDRLVAEQRAPHGRTGTTGRG